jgi:hypothetical protein
MNWVNKLCRIRKPYFGQVRQFSLTPAKELHGHKKCSKCPNGKNDQIAANISDSLPLVDDPP